VRWGLRTAALACKGFRKELQDGGRSGKTAQNILGVLHKAMTDAVEEGLLASNPVPQLPRKTARRVSLSNSDPLTVAEVKLFLSNVPDWYRDLYVAWFRIGWRPSEILAIRFDWIDFHRQTVHLKRGANRTLGRRRSSAKDG
jgi:integrase